MGTTGRVGIHHLTRMVSSGSLCFLVVLVPVLADPLPAPDPLSIHIHLDEAMSKGKGSAVKYEAAANPPEPIESGDDYWADEYISYGGPKHQIHDGKNMNSLKNMYEYKMWPPINVQCSCGKAPLKEQNRIIGGREATPHEFPWMVKITGGCAKGSCGGALISPRLVLSSFHCAVPSCAIACDVKKDKLCEYAEKYLKCNGNKWPWNYSKPCDHSDEKRIAVLGQHTMYPEMIKNYYTIPIIDVKHQKNPDLFEPSGDYDSHDLAIMVLKTPAKFSEKINSICLPEPGQDFSGKMASAAGWGRFAPANVTSILSPWLRVVDLKVSDKKYKHKNVLGTELLKKDGWYSDPCGGDSGGPLMYWNKWRQHYIVIGTVIGYGYSCKKNNVSEIEGSHAGVWNKVANFVPYIKGVMQSMGETACRSNIHNVLYDSD